MHLVYQVHASVKIFGLGMTHVRFMLGLVVQSVNSVMDQAHMTVMNVLKIPTEMIQENAYA